MSGESFEWAIKKDIRNNPIVREVDLERHRDMWRSVGVGVFLVFTLLLFAWPHFKMLSYGYDIEYVQRKLTEEIARERQLRMEVEVLSSLKVIEGKATTDLKMVKPGPEDAIIIERVVEPPSAPSSAVASR